jgi:hypothetical protein
MPLAVHRVFLALLLLRFGLVPLVLGGIFARVHDNLDSALAYNVLIARFWAGGMDATALSLPLNGVLDWTHYATLTWPMLLPYAVLPPAWAYTLTEFAVVVLAYVSMLALLRELLRNGTALPLMAALFAMTLSFSTLGIGLAAAPLVVRLALRGGGLWVWGAMVLLGWNSSLIMHAMFLPVIVLVIAVCFGRDWRPAVVPILFYLAGAIVGSAPLFAHVLGGYQDHRSLWSAEVADLSLGELAKTLATGLLTQGAWYHATITPALYTAVFLLAGLLASTRLAVGVLAVTVIALVVDFLSPWLAQVLPGLLASLQFDRIGQFSGLMVILLGASIMTRAPQARAARWVRGAAIVTLVQAALVWSGINLASLRATFPPEIRSELRIAAKEQGWRTALAQSGISMSRFLAAIPTVPSHMRSADYACIAQNVGGAMVASAGPDPMLAPLHGMRAVDGYHYMYPASWHRAFRPVIAEKLAASDSLRAYYDDWGNRVSLFIDQVPEVSPDFAALAELGVGYVIADRALELMQVQPTGCALSAPLRLYRL